jgi:hypothetical protein
MLVLEEPWPGVMDVLVNRYFLVLLLSYAVLFCSVLFSEGQSWSKLGLCGDW